MLTALVTSASFPPLNTTRLNEIFAVEFFIVNGCGLLTTKLKVRLALAARPALFWLPPITHFADWPTMLPWSSSRKQTARADSTVSPKLFFIFSWTTAFCPTIFGGETLTTSCAVANSGHNQIKQIRTKQISCNVVFISKTAGFSAKVWPKPVQGDKLNRQSGNRSIKVSRHSRIYEQRYHN